MVLQMKDPALSFRVLTAVQLNAENPFEGVVGVCVPPGDRF